MRVQRAKEAEMRAIVVRVRIFVGGGYAYVCVCERFEEMSEVLGGGKMKREGRLIREAGLEFCFFGEGLKEGVLFVGWAQREGECEWWVGGWGGVVEFFICCE